MGRKSEKKIKVEEKSKRKANSIVLLLLAFLMFFAWIGENKNLKSSQLIEIEGNLISYQNRRPGNRGAGYEGNELFLKLSNYKAEFNIHLDYDKFQVLLQPSSGNTIKTFIEPKYKKQLNRHGCDVETIGLVVNNKTIRKPNEQLKERNSMMTYGVPIIGLIMLILGINEIICLKRK